VHVKDAAGVAVDTAAAVDGDAVTVVVGKHSIRGL
jgi:hypothetical protein